MSDGDTGRLVRNLAEVPAVTGFEGPVIQRLADIYRSIPDTTAHIDHFGNLIAAGPASGGPKILFLSHVDRAGFVVNLIRDNGLLSVAPLGKHLDARNLVAQRLVIDGLHGPVLGVVGTFKLAHLVAGGKQGAPVPEIRDLVIDIGATSAENASELGVQKGSQVYFEPAWRELSRRQLIGPGLSGCAGTSALLTMAQGVVPNPAAYQPLFAHVILREAGHLGARVAVTSVEPTLAIVVEAVPAENGVEVGAGPVARIIEQSMDILHGHVVPKILRDALPQAASNAGVTAQIDIYAGDFLTAATQIHMRDAGYPCIGLGIPVRNAHSAGEIASMEDIEAAARLAAALADVVVERGVGAT